MRVALPTVHVALLAIFLAGCSGATATAVVVTVDPASASVVAGKMQQFHATVTGSSNTAVTWSVKEGVPGGAVDAEGRYAAPMAAGSYHVVATSVADATSSSAATVTVTIAAPAQLTYAASTLTCSKGTACMLAAPTSTGGAIASFAISPALPAGLSLDAATGAIVGTPTVVAAPSSYVVSATNAGGSTTASLSIAVNDVAPSALSYVASPAVYTLGQAIPSASPTFSGGAPTAFLIGEPFSSTGLSFDTASGTLSGTPTALLPPTTFTVTASNSGGSTTAQVSIAVVDVAPSALTYSPSILVCTKGLACALAAPLSSGGTIVSFTVTPALPAGLTFNGTSGAISGTPAAAAPLGTVSYSVTATNTGGSSHAPVSVTVNDTAPGAISYVGTLTCTKGVACSLAAPSVSGGAVVSFAISPALTAGLAINATSGGISGTPSVISAIAIYTVTATNSGGTNTGSVTVLVKDTPPLSVTYSGSLVCALNLGCSLGGPTVTGGAAVSFSISPAPPTGLVFDTALGGIAGTSTMLSPQASYTVTATNSGGSASGTVSVLVRASAPLSVTYASPLTCTKSAPCKSVTPSTTGDAVVTFFVAPALPAGLSINGGTGVISGTPTAIAASATFTLTGSNSGGSVSGSLAVTVNDLAPATLTYASSTLVCTLNSSCSLAAPSATGGVVVSYGVSPALPAGLSLNTSTGAITGVGSAVSAAASYTITATNSGGSTSAAISITIASVPTAPTQVFAVAGNTTATITWTAPSANGSAITSYVVTASAGGFTATTSGTSAQLTGLTNGATYSFSVVAKNALGAGPTAVSNPITPDPLTVTGTVTFSDGAPLPAAGVSILFYASPTQITSLTTSAGIYSAQVTSGTWNVIVQYSDTNFSTQGRSVIASQSITVASTLNVVIPHIVVSGFIQNSSGAGVTGVALAGFTADYSNLGGFDTIYATSGATGAYSLSMMPQAQGNYSNLTLTPPASTSYVTTSLPSTALTTSSRTTNFIIQLPTALSGVVSYSDGTAIPAAGIKVQFYANGNTSPATSDGSGKYSVSMAPGSYNVIVSYADANFSTQGRSIIDAQTISGSTQTLNVVVPVITVAGLVQDTTAKAVANVGISAITADYSNLGGFDTLHATSAANGSYSIKMMPINASSGGYPITLMPAAGSPYVTTVLAAQKLSASTSANNLIIQSPVAVSGTVAFSDASALPSAGIGVKFFASGATYSATANASGAYSISLAPGTYNIIVSYGDTSWSTQGRSIVDAQAVSGATQTVNVTIPIIYVTGKMLSAGGAGLAGVVLTGLVADYSNVGGFDTINLISGTGGGFLLRMMASPYAYANLTMTPPSGSGSAVTTLASQIFSASITQNYTLH